MFKWSHPQSKKLSFVGHEFGSLSAFTHVQRPMLPGAHADAPSRTHGHAPASSSYLNTVASARATHSAARTCIFVPANNTNARAIPRELRLRKPRPHESFSALPRQKRAPVKNRTAHDSRFPLMDGEQQWGICPRAYLRHDMQIGAASHCSRAAPRCLAPRAARARARPRIACHAAWRPEPLWRV